MEVITVVAENGMQRFLGVSSEAPELLADSRGAGSSGIWDLPVRRVQEGAE